MKTIDSFKNEYAFLSNFYPCFVEYGGLRFPSVEHAYQAAKCRDRSDMVKFTVIPTPGEAKKAGRLVAMRDDWELIKLDVMTDLVAQKFERPDLKAKLLQTRDSEIVEGNWWNDTFWGVCKGVGCNHLGKILMNVRNSICKNDPKIVEY